MLKTEIGRLRVIAIVEGISFLLLLGVAMPLKYLAGQPIFVKIMGPIHGFLFVGFSILLLNAKISVGWSFGRSFLIFMSSILPFGTFIMDKSLKIEDEKRRLEKSEEEAE